MKLRIFFAVSFVFVFFVPHISHAELFARDLHIGSQGVDVHALQKLLNTDARTRVAVSGPGAPGFETDYFGPRTQVAVKHFQELNAPTILAPLNLPQGTGYVGPLTRKQLNSGKINISPPQSVTANNAASSGVTYPPVIYSISPTQGGVDTEVTIKGDHFTPTGNDIGAVFEVFKNVPSSDGKTLTVMLHGPFPDEVMEENQEGYNKLKLTFPYSLVVRTVHGQSNPIPFEFLLYEE